MSDANGAFELWQDSMSSSSFHPGVAEHYYRRYRDLTKETHVSKDEKFPEDPNAAGPQAGTELRPGPHAPKVVAGKVAGSQAAIGERMVAALRLVSIMSNTLKYGETKPNGETYRPALREQVENILNTFIDSARTIMGVEK